MNFKDCLDLENAASKEVESFKKKLINEIASAKNPKAKVISDSPRVCFVRLSDLGDSWAPEYYMQQVQAKIVESFLNGSTTATSLLKKLMSIVDNRKVRVNNQTHYLNDITVSVIKKRLEEIKQS